MRLLDKHLGWVVLILFLACSVGCAGHYVVRRGKVLELSRDYELPVWIQQEDGSLVEGWVQFFEQDTVVRDHVSDATEEESYNATRR